MRLFLSIAGQIENSIASFHSTVLASQFRHVNTNYVICKIYKDGDENIKIVMYVYNTVSILL